MEELIYVVIDLDEDKKDCVHRAFTNEDKAKEFANQLGKLQESYSDFKDSIIIREIYLLS